MEWELCLRDLYDKKGRVCTDGRHSHTADIVERFAVDGGFIYRNITTKDDESEGSMIVSLVYVPDPERWMEAIARILG